MNYKANSFNGEMCSVSQSDRRGVESLDSGLPNRKSGMYGTADVGACFRACFAVPDPKKSGPKQIRGFDELGEFYD